MVIVAVGVFVGRGVVLAVVVEVALAVTVAVEVLLGRVVGDASPPLPSASSVAVKLGVSVWVAVALVMELNV